MNAKLDNNYYIHVGIMSAPTISFTLDGGYTLDEKRLLGEYRVEASGDYLLFQGNVYRLY